MALPTVTVEDFTIELGMTLAATEFLTAFDSDGDSIDQIWVRDNDASATSSRLVYNGTDVPANAWVPIDYLQLNQLILNAGSSIGSNQFQFRAESLGQLGPIVDAVIYSVVANTTRPVLTTSTASVVQNEFLSVSDFISASDPDGHPIHRYKVWDANGGATSATLELNGSTFAAGEWHYVDAADWNDLRLVAGSAAPNFDPIWVRAYDKGSWSLPARVETFTTANLNRPIVIPTSTNIATGESQAIADLFDWFDADSNTLKSIRLFDTGPHSFTGYIRESGVELASGQWHERDISALANLEWVAADRNLTEQVRIQVSDGTHWSDITTFRVGTDEKPVIAVNKDISIRQQLEFVDMSELVVKLDDGPVHTQYEVFDATTNVKSGDFRLGATVLPAGQVHQLTQQEFFDLEFKSGVYEERSLDELYVRSNNGTFWSDWTRHNVRTEPEYLDSLVAESWLNYRTPTNGILEMTYSFYQGWPGYGSGGGATEVEFISLWPEAREGIRAAMRDLETLINVDYEEVPDTLNGEFGRGGTIRFGSYCLGPDPPVAAYATFPGPAEINGDIFFNRYFMGNSQEYFIPPSAGGMDPPCGWPTDDDPPVVPPGFNIPSDAWGPGTPNYAIVLHELGHANGLKHPFDDTPVLPPATDSGLFTLMSYAGVPGSEFGSQLYDIAALQAIYGPNNNYRTGDDVYDASTWDGSLNVFASVWDAGGNDTFDMSAQASGGSIDLRAGSFSDFGGSGSVSIAFTVEIENAIGGSGGDTLIGNESVNEITGNDGGDTIQGHGGNDILRGGAGNDRYIFNMADGHDNIDEMSGAGRDSVAVELFNGFDDFSKDVVFTKENYDLVIDFKIDEGISRGSVRIENQAFGRNRIETLDVFGTQVDLRYLFENITSPGQSFSLTSDMGQYGLLVAVT